MSKELTPLENFEYLIRCLAIDTNEEVETIRKLYAGTIKVIETTLKEQGEQYKKPLVLMGRTHGQTKALIDEISKHYKEVKITNLVDEKKLKALAIITNITKHTSHFRLKERQNFGEDEMSYYLVIGYGMGECEYKLKSKEEFDLLKEELI